MVERMRAEIPRLPAERIRLLEPEVGFELAEGLVTSGRDGLYARVDGDRRAVANVVMNQLAATGVDPDGRDAGELARLVEARERIPRSAFDEAIARARGAGVLAPIRTSRRRPCPTPATLDPLIDEILAANPGQVDGVSGTARRGCSASSSAR